MIYIPIVPGTLMMGWTHVPCYDEAHILTDMTKQSLEESAFGVGYPKMAFSLLKCDDSRWRNDMI